MKPNPVGWFEIYVDDIERAKAFYESVFQVKLERLNTPVPDLEMYSFPHNMEQYGAGGAIVKLNGFSSGRNSVIVYFTCEDCSVEQGRVEAAGGQIHQGKFPIGEYGHIALVVDTEGNMVGLHSLK
jgi:predicted enzyme related to lactoylglutathione lyase